jgi:transcriptional regulator GlxA family with amidase domain
MNVSVNDLVAPHLTLQLPADDALDPRVQKVLELVSIGVTYSIRDLAHQLCLTPSYVQRLFKRATGARLGEWLIEQRLERAAHLLQYGHLSVKQITLIVGYAHVPSFTRAFEHRFHRAPTVYRKQRRQLQGGAQATMANDIQIVGAGVAGNTGRGVR